MLKGAALSENIEETRGALHEGIENANYKRKFRDSIDRKVEIAKSDPESVVAISTQRFSINMLYKEIRGDLGKRSVLSEIIDHPDDVWIALRTISNNEINVKKELEKLLTKWKGALTKATETVGERGGELLLKKRGYEISGEFYGSPGKGRIDALAVNLQEGRIIVAEFKGGSSKLTKKKYPLTKLGDAPAAQATPRYMLDRMLMDDRVSTYFAGTPELWARVKVGEVKITTEAIITKLTGESRIVYREDIPLDSDFKHFVSEMDDLIDKLRDSANG